MNQRKRINSVKLGFVVAAILCAFSGFSQIKKANEYFDAMHYTKAIELYEKVLQKQEDSIAVKNIAEAYRRTKDLKKAEVFYKRAAELYPNDKQIQLTYAQLLKSNEKLDSAKEVFIVYASKNPNDIFGQKYILSCDQIKSWQVEIPNFEAQIEDKLSTESSEFSPVEFDKGLIIVTDRYEDHIEGTETGNETPYLKIAYSEQQEDSSYSKPKPVRQFNNNYHSGPICFNANQTLAVFTQVGIAKKQDKEFVNKPQLYISKKEGNSWSKPEPFQYNDINYSFAHATLSPDESQLFFASDKKGGYGGFDIYVSKRAGNSWSEPVNLGAKVNTYGNEVFPFAYSNDSVYFSSNTLVGYGGQDIFYTTYQNNEWTTPMNLKNQVNSAQDDFGIIFTDKKHGFFSSNRDGGKGNDDIYSFTLIRELRERTSVSGIFLYSELDPAKNATITLLDEEGNIMMVTQTNEKGEFKFEDLESDRNYIFSVNEDDPNLTLESKMYLTNDKGEKIVALNQPGPGMFKFRTLPPDEIASLPTIEEEDVELTFIDIYGQLFNKLPGDYSTELEVLLVDDNGFVVETTKPDSIGNFTFQNILALSDYKIQLTPDENLQLVYTDGKGNQVAEAERSADGLYDYKKQQFIANSTVFGRVYKELPGDFGNKMEIYLVDDEGNIVYTALTDENGNFIFENLPPDQQFLLKMKDEDGNFKLLLLDEAGEPKEMAQKNENGDYVLQERKEELDRFFGKVYQKLPGDFNQTMEVYLVDDEGNIIYTTTTDENGNFVFDKLPSDKNYSIKFQNSSDDLNMIVLNEFGDVQSKGTKSADGNFNTQADESQNSLFGNIYQKLPGDFNQAMEVYLVDDEGNIVYTTTTDENGDFVFVNLPPDHKYKLKLQKDDDLSLMVLNDFGSPEKLVASATGDFDVAEKPKRDIFGNIYQTLPGDISDPMKLNLLNDDGKLVYTTTSDKEGNFRFKNLPSDKNFTVQLADADPDINMVLLTPEGEVLGEATKKGDGKFDVNVPETSFSGRVYHKLPGDFNQTMEVYLVDDEGNIVYTTTTDENGNFNFQNLPSDKNFIVRFESQDQDMKLLLLDESGNELGDVKTAENGDFVYEYLSSKKEYISLLTLDDVIIKIKEEDQLLTIKLYFEYDSYTLTKPSQKELDKIVVLLKKNPHVGLNIAGHSDGKGADEYNQKLSEKRAAGVVSLLTKKGINKNRLTAKGYGEKMPIAPNITPGGEDYPEGRAKNRRAEIHIIRLKP